MEKFTTSFSGYSKREVDKFLSDVTTEYESLLKRLKEADQKLRDNSGELENYKNMESSFRRAILLAEEGASNVKKAAFEESKVLMDDARKNANRIVNDALLRAERIDAEKESLRRKVFVYKKRFRSVVEDALDEIEKYDDTI